MDDAKSKIEAKILRALIDEHIQNLARDSSYSALNADLVEDAQQVQNVALDFIDRLISDGVVNGDVLIWRIRQHSSPN